MTIQKYHLIMRSGPTPGKQISLEKAEMSIGRELSNDIPIVEPEISRRHARIVKRDDSYMIEDLGSTNGTFVNDVRVSALHPLKTGDVITLGETTVFLFDMEHGVPAEKAPESQIPEPPIQSEVQPVQPQPAYQPVMTPAVEPVVPVIPVAQPVEYPSVVSEPAQLDEEQIPEAPRTKKKMPVWLIVVLILVLALCIIPALILTFMPETWWCSLASFFSYQLAGCPIL